MDGDLSLPREEEHLLLLTNIFRPVITVYLNVEPALLTSFQLNGLINAATASEIHKLKSQKSNEAAVEFLLQNISVAGRTGDYTQQYSNFLNGLRSSTDQGNQDLADHIEGLKHLPSLRDERQQFCRILKDLHPFLVDSIIPTNILPRLSQFFSKADTEEIVAMEKERGPPHAAFSMLLLLQRSGSDWHRHFVTACRETGLTDVADTLELTLEKCKAAESILEQTSAPGYSELHEQNGVPKENVSQTFSNRQESSVTDGYERRLPYPLANSNSFHENQRQYNQRQDAFNDFNLNIPNEVKAFQSASNKSSPNLPLFGPTEDEEDGDSTLYNSLRMYQRELAQPAIRGLNTVLIAPTGTGKTHVAAYIIDRHIKRLKAEGNKAKVVFIVHTKVLAAQQQKKIEELLEGEQDLMIVEATGESLDSPLTEIINFSDVVVLTAQVLLNGLTEGNDVVDMRDLTLMIFDECHNCQLLESFRFYDMDLIYNEITSFLCMLFQAPRGVNDTKSLNDKGNTGGDIITLSLVSAS